MEVATPIPHHSGALLASVQIDADLFDQNGTAVDWTAHAIRLKPHQGLMLYIVARW